MLIIPIKKLHISFHKDNSVWITRHDPRKTDQIIIEQGSEEINDIRQTLTKNLSPFFAYRPLDFSKYPNTKAKDLNKSNYIISIDQNELPKMILVLSILDGSKGEKIPDEIMQKINEIGIFKIGKTYSWRGTDNTGNRQEFQHTYLPLFLGSHLFHLCVDTIKIDIECNHGSMYICNLFNRYESPKNFIENLSLALTTSLPRGTAAMRRQGKDADIREIIFAPPNSEEP